MTEKGRAQNDALIEKETYHFPAARCDKTVGTSCAAHLIVIWTAAFDRNNVTLETAIIVQHS